MINWQPLPPDPTNLPTNLEVANFPSHFPNIAEIDTLRMFIFTDREMKISYWEGESFIYKKYCIESDRGHQFVDTSLDIFRGGLAVTAKKLQVFIHDRRSLSCLPLESSVEQQLLDYLLQGPPIPTFCCLDFVQKLFDKYVPQSPHVFNRGEWKFSRSSKNKLLKTGEAIALGQGRKVSSIRHFAFCLGQDLYLSVAGDGGHLIVTELEEMKNLYQARNVFVICPIKKMARN